MPHPRDGGPLTGPRLLGAFALGLTVMVLALALAVSPGPAAARAVIVWTARTSLALFALAYVARPLVQLRPSPPTKALLARRKWLGLGFAVSHGYHLVGILWYASADLGAFVRSQEPTVLVALATFVAIGAMAVTSVEAVRRAMPARAWRRLHATGMHLAWLSFAFTYVFAIAASPLYALPSAILLAIGAVRLAAWLRARRHAAARPQRFAA